MAASAFVAPTAVLIGDVEIGDESSIWFGVVIRADNGPIRVGARTSVQDNSVVHVSQGSTTIIGDDCTIGHCVTMEDCVIENGALIGSNAVVLNGARVGSKALVAASSVVAANANVPPETLNAGAPALVKRRLEGESLGWIVHTPAHYVELSRSYLQQSIGDPEMQEKHRDLPLLDVFEDFRFGMQTRSRPVVLAMYSAASAVATSVSGRAESSGSEYGNMVAQPALTVKRNSTSWASRTLRRTASAIATAPASGVRVGGSRTLRRRSARRDRRYAAPRRRSCARPRSSANRRPDDRSGRCTL